jgi:serine/threonine-protein kinase
MLMEFVDGITLEELVRSGPLRLEEAVNYVAQVCDALAYAHSKGIVHRDLKPSNMMLTPEGVVKLLDFGIAKFVQDRSMTKTGFLVGSLPYISPEQIEGLPDIDGRTDIYSLGITLYQLVTGRVPFEADSEYSLMRKHLQEAPVPPVQWMPDVPQGLNEIILTAMEKDRSRRFQSAAAMGAALRSLAASLGVTTAAPAMSTPTPSSGWNAAAPAPSPEQAWGAPPAPQPRKHSSRALYIVIGSVATIAVLVVAAMQLPRFFGTRAGAPAAVESQAPPPEAQPAQQASETPAPAEQPAQPAPTAEAQPASSQPLAAGTSGGSLASSGSPASPARRMESQPAAQRRPQAAEPAAYQSPAAEPAYQPSAQAQQAAPAPAVPAAPAVDERELSELRERLMVLGARVNAAQASLNRLKQEQARMGLGLRGDIAASAQRMEFYMDEAEAAIKRGDASAAKRHLENADRETARLEKFLGR